LNELNRHHGLTIMLVSHDIDVVANEVHKLLLLNRKVIAFRPAKEITSKGYLEKLYGDKVDFVFHHHHHDHH
jgi:zinc transport system ATP-binding protein